MIDIKKLKEQARKYTKEHINIYAMYTLILFLVYINLVENGATFYGETIFPIIAFLVTVGLSAISLEIIRTNTSNLEKGLYGFKNLMTFALTYLLKSVIIFLHLLLLFIPGFIKIYALSMTEYILIDNPDMPVIDAMRESTRMTKGHKLNLFWLTLTFIGYYLLIPFTFGLILFYIVPYSNISYANYYLKLKELNKEQIKEA